MVIYLLYYTMKGLSFVFMLLCLDVHASFMDDFRGAISHLNSGFGKLLGDVVTDVKDTLYCTISAVEQVLVQNGLLDKRTLYNQKCKGHEKPKESSMDFRDGSTTKTVSKIHKHSVIHHTHTSRRKTHESNHTIKNVNKTIIDVLGNSDLTSVPAILKAETDHLAEISKILKEESENISMRFNNEIKKMQDDKNQQSTVESILDDIKHLNEVRRNSQNDTEIAEIRRIIDKVTKRMNLKLDSDKVLETQELEDFKNELHKYSNNNEKLNTTTAKQTDNTQNSLEPKTNGTIVLNPTPPPTENKIQPVEPRESLFEKGIDSLKSFFKSIAGSPHELKRTKDLVADSQHSEKFFNDFYNG